MDEKTSELRDLFLETTGSESVTERQAESRGTLTDRDDESVGERVRELVAAMRERYGFSTDLDDETYARIARGRFEESDDAAIAEAIVEERNGDERDSDERDNEGSDGDERNSDERNGKGSNDGTDDSALDPETVRAARFDLHLVRESDREVDGAEFDYADLKRLTAEGRSIVECAEALDADADIDAVAEYARIARVDLTSTRANDRFRDEFRDLLTDAEIEGPHAATAREDGLKEATEDIETDVSL